MHARQQIRNAFVAALSGLPTTGSNVFNGRFWPVHDGILPALCVFTRQEEISEEKGKKERLQYRRLQILVQAHAKAETTVDTLLDTIAEEIEAAVWPVISGQFPCLDLLSTDFDTSQEGELATAVMNLTFSIEYQTVNGQPGVIQ